MPSQQTSWKPPFYEIQRVRTAEAGDQEERTPSYQIVRPRNYRNRPLLPAATSPPTEPAVKEFLPDQPAPGAPGTRIQRPGQSWRRLDQTLPDIADRSADGGRGFGREAYRKIRAPVRATTHYQSSSQRRNETDRRILNGGARTAPPRQPLRRPWKPFRQSRSPPLRIKLLGMSR
jgi:hypothetical protein